MHRAGLCSMVLLSLTAMRALAAPETRPTVPPESAAIPALVQQLGSDDFATREHAQRALEGLPPGALEQLQHFADAAGDPEIKTRLNEIVGMVEEIAATTPPPISLDIKNAFTSEVAAALGKATGTHIGVPSGTPAGDEDRVTLKIVDQPFWEVMRQLSREHTLWITADPPVLSRQAFQQVQIIRGMALTAGEPKVTAPGKISYTISGAIDPRIKVLALHDMEIDDPRDDKGNVLHLDPDTPANARNGLRRMGASGTANLFQTRTFVVNRPASPGQHITVKGTFKCLVQIAASTTEIANAGKHLNESIAVGDNKITLRGIDQAANAGANSRGTLHLEMVPKDSNVQPPAAPNIEFTANGMSIKGNLSASAGTNLIIDIEGTAGGFMLGTPAATGESTQVTVTDATGKVVADYALPRGVPLTSLHAVTGRFQEPLTFKFSFPSKTREVSIPFEFKDLPFIR